MITAWVQAGIAPRIILGNVQLHNTAYAISTSIESTEGSIAGAWTNIIADSSPSNNWSGAAVYSGTTGDYLGQQWPVAHQVKEIWIRMYRWSRDLRIRAGDSMATLQTIRTISLQTAFNDDFGVPFSGNVPTNTLSRLAASDGYNKFTLPNYTAAKFLVIDAPTYASSIVGDGTGGPNSRIGIHKVQLLGV